MTPEQALELIESLPELCEKATPIYQKSRFVDKYPRMPEDEKQCCREKEKQVVRGPGIVGTPECNGILAFAREEDRDFAVAARVAIPLLLGMVEEMIEGYCTMPLTRRRLREDVIRASLKRRDVRRWLGEEKEKDNDTEDAS